MKSSNLEFIKRATRPISLDDQRNLEFMKIGKRVDLPLGPLAPMGPYLGPRLVHKDFCEV